MEQQQFNELCVEFGLFHLIGGLSFDEARRVIVHFDQCPKCGARGYTCQLSEIVDREIGGCSACEYCEFIQYPAEAIRTRLLFAVYARQSPRHFWHVQYWDRDRGRIGLLANSLYKDCNSPRSYQAWRNGEIVTLEWIGGLFDELPDNTKDLPAGQVVQRVKIS